LRFSILAATSLAVAAATVAHGAVSESSAKPRVLVFTKTAGFRHTSIPAAIAAVRELGADSGLDVDATEDASAFTDANLRRYDAVVFLLTTGDVLRPAQQAAFERFIRRGGGYAGVHSAADTEHDWPWYGRLVGAYFLSHPPIQTATVRVGGARSPALSGLPRAWRRTDEWYNFDRNPRGTVRVLATVDEATYAPGPGAMGPDHPIAWAHAYDGGRAWYTAGGHTEESYSDPMFVRHIIGGIRYAAGASPPRIRALAAAVRGRRVSVTVRYATCRPCRGRLVVRGRATSLRFGDGVARATSAPQRPGRYRVGVVLDDPYTLLTAAESLMIRIR
jgi:type 1 glutamine amidotransferase